MGSSVTQPQATEIPLAQIKYWCFQCQAEIQNPLVDMKCPHCSSSAIQQITSTNDPRGHDIFTVQSENNEPQPQQPIILNTHPNPSFTNFSLNNGGITFTMVNHTNFPWDRMNANLQNLFRMMSQQGQVQTKATAEQLSLLEIAEVDECIICQEEGGQGLKLGCGHTFHNHCILPWLDRKNNCPTCRTVLKRE